MNTRAQGIPRRTFKQLASLGYPVRFFARLIFEFEPVGDPLFYSIHERDSDGGVLGLVCWFDCQKLSTDSSLDVDSRALLIQRDLCENLGVVNIKDTEEYSILDRKQPHS